MNAEEAANLTNNYNEKYVADNIDSWIKTIEENIREKASNGDSYCTVPYTEDIRDGSLKNKLYDILKDHFNTFYVNYNGGYLNILWPLNLSKEIVEKKGICPCKSCTVNIESIKEEYNEVKERYKIVLEEKLLSQLDLTINNEEITNVKSFLNNEYSSVRGGYDESIELDDDNIILSTTGDESFPYIFIDLMEKYSGDKFQIPEADDRYRGYLTWKIRIK